MIPYLTQKKRLIKNLDAARTMLRSLVADDAYLSYAMEVAVERHEEGFTQYGDALIRSEDYKIDCDIIEEIADALVYLAEKSAREREA